MLVSKSYMNKITILQEILYYNDRSTYRKMMKVVNLVLFCSKKRYINLERLKMHSLGLLEPLHNLNTEFAMRRNTWKDLNKYGFVQVLRSSFTLHQSFRIV